MELVAEYIPCKLFFGFHEQEQSSILARDSFLYLYFPCMYVYQYGRIFGKADFIKYLSANPSDSSLNQQNIVVHIVLIDITYKRDQPPSTEFFLAIDIS